MRRTMSLIAMFTILLSASISLGDESVAEQSLRLAVDLTDGSRIIGVPAGSSVRVKTAYAQMDIGLKHILSISVKADNEIAVTQFRNGDRLSGLLELDELRMTTLIGEVSIPVQHVKTISVQDGGPLATNKEHLVLYYSFDKDEGAEVSDLSGRGNHGEVHGAKWTNQGKVGGAYEFDGQAYIALPDGRFFDGYTDATICAWINCHLPSGQGGEILGSGDPRGGKDPVSTRISTTMFADFGLCDTVSNTKIESVGEVAGMRPHSWQMLAITLKSEPARSSCRVYLDGNLIDSQEHPGGFSITYDEDMPTQIGAIHGTQGWVGLIDELMIFDRALSESEIRQLYLGQK